MVKESSIIFFDIDGTLLTEGDKLLPPSTKDAIFQLKKLGHEVAIATGRAPFMFEDIRKELEIDTYVCYNGQYVVYKGEVIYANPLKASSLEELTQFALDRDHPIVFMNHESMKANVPEDHDYIQESINSLKSVHYPTHDPAFYKGREIYQALLFNTAGEEKQYEKAFEDFQFVRWHDKSVDILPANGSKANGIKKLLAYTDYPDEKQYAFGDGLNDIEMLTEVQNSVAMGNGQPEAKAAARYITRPVNNDGILHGLKMVGLL